ncbi:MAG: hypothetical protein FWG66_05125 [Spirochaetes bacterium]|nr:hypothetical protein [Spirochaetota bacterium]
MKKTKKLFGIAALVAAFSTISAGGVFAQAFSQLPLSFGISSSFISDFGGGVSGSITEVAAPPQADSPPNRNAFRLGHELYWHPHYVGRATSVFFDAHFVQFSFSYFTSTATHRARYSPGAQHTPYTSFVQGGGHPFGLEFGILGKFPVELSPLITVFPLGGVVYRLVLGGSAVNPPHFTSAAAVSTNPIHLSAPWFRLGGGMDFNLTAGMFLRTTLTYGIRLRNRFENDILNSDPVENWQAGVTGTPPNEVPFDQRVWADYNSSRLGHGVDITVGIGFRLR